MALTYVAIATVTVGSGGAANIEFTSIPATYTDLLIKISARNETAGNSGIFIQFNGSTSNFTNKYLEANGSTVYSGSFARYLGTEVAAGQTANTFSNGEVYIPNYVGSNNKSFSADDVSENNATQAYATLTAGLWSNSSAITSIKLTLVGVEEFNQYSTATLYGIKNTV